MGKKGLKSLVALLAALITCSPLGGCPSCVGRLKLGVKKPFFELYRPESTTKRTSRHEYLQEALSCKSTNTLVKPEKPQNENQEEQS